MPARPTLISSKTNPIIKQARALRERKERARSGLFLVEGIHAVGEAVAARWDIEAILYAPDDLRSDYALALVADFPGRVERLSSEALNYLAGKENPQGIVALVHQRQRNFGDVGKVTLGAALVSPQDPGNVGTVVRTLDAVGGDVLFLLDGGVDAYHPTVIRASMGTSFWIPMVEGSFEGFLAWRQKRAVELLGTSAHGGRPSTEFRPTAPWVLLLGSEQKGLTSEQKQRCDVLLSLPMRGRASSLNLAVAAGVFLYSLSN